MTKQVTWMMAAALAAMGCGTTVETAVRPAFDTTHVTLYDCGLAQIERQADVQGASELAIEVEQAHLDDLVASLVLATDGNVTVKGVTFPGVQNLGQATAASGLGNSLFDGSSGLELPSDMLGYARAMTGMRVVIALEDGENIAGTILDAVSETDVMQDGETEGIVEVPRPVLVLITEEGAMRWIDLESVLQIAPASQLEAASIQNFASALGNANGFKETEILLETAADSDGKLAASYIRQAPVWRIVYKMKVIEGEVVLEAWAVVHNDTSEDWEDVSMTLISGMPSSYVMSLASPRYVHREVAEAPGAIGELFPQLGATTPDSLLYDWEIWHASSGWSGGSYGYGAGGGSYGTSPNYGVGGFGTISYGEGASSLLQVGESAVEEGMIAEVEEEISTYTSMNPVTLPSGATSLVPLIRRKLPGKAFTLISSGTEPSTCVWMQNGTGLVLQPGAASFYEDGRFRGQAEIDRLEPGDIRVLCYGYDEDVSFARKTQVTHGYAAVEWKLDGLWVHDLRRTEYTYEIENFAGQDRELAIEITHIQNGRVVTPKDLVETDSETRWLAMVVVEPRSEITKIVDIEEGIQSPVPLVVAEIDDILEPGSLPAKQVVVLEKAKKILAGKEEIAAQVAEKSAQIAELEADIAWKKDLLGTVPETGDKSKAVDQILGDVLKAKKKIDALKDDVEKLEEEMAEVEKEAREVLEVLVPPPVAAG